MKSRLKSITIFTIVIIFKFDTLLYGQNQSNISGSNQLKHPQNAITFLINDQFELGYKRVYSENIYFSFSLIVNRLNEHQSWSQVMGGHKLFFSETNDILKIGFRVQLLYDLYKAELFRIVLGIGPILFYKHTNHETFIHETNDFREYSSNSWNYGLSTTTGVEIKAFRELFLSARYEIVVNYYNKKSDLQSGRGWLMELDRLMLGATLYF